MLQRPESRKILLSLRDESSSLLWLRDDESCGTRRSTYTETSEFLDASFVFDPEVFKSRAYLAVMKSNLKRAVRGSAHRTSHSNLSSKPSKSTAYDTPGLTDQTEHAQFSTLPEELHSSNSSGMTMSETGFPDDLPDTHNDDSSIAPTTESIDRPEGGARTRTLSPGRSENTVALEGLTGKVGEHAQKSILRFASSSMSKISIPISSSESTQTIADRPGGGNAQSETEILLTGTSRTVAEELARSMKLAYGQNYSEADKRAFRVSIYDKVVRDIRETLFFMADLGMAFQNPGSERHAHDILTMPLTLTREHLAPDIIDSLIALWSDPGVVDAFHQKRLHDNHDGLE